MIRNSFELAEISILVKCDRLITIRNPVVFTMRCGADVLAIRVCDFGTHLKNSDQNFMLELNRHY